MRNVYFKNKGPDRIFGGDVKKMFLFITVTLLHSERSKLYIILAFLSAIGLTHYDSPVELMFKVGSNERL